MQTLESGAGTPEKLEPQTKNIQVYFTNPKNLEPLQVNICQVTVSTTMIQMDAGYLSPIEMANAASSVDEAASQMPVVLNGRWVMEISVARQIHSILDQILKALEK